MPLYQVRQITLKQHYTLTRAVSSHTLFTEHGDVLLFILKILQT